MATDQASELLAELEKYELLSPPQFAEARSLFSSSGPEARRLAGELIQRGWLTPFQVNQVLQGRGQKLVLGPYILLERLGQGGMGQVYKARHKLMDRVVALKVIHGERLGDPESLARFRREMQAAAKLAHANVVIAHDAAQSGDTYYLVMEYVEGTDLGRLLKKQGALPVELACDYIRQAALGLQHAHERGLVHRDLKPSNLMVGKDGTVKILDLGLARLRRQLDKDETASDLTREGSVMGTPDYLAPEQAISPHTADIRADIYSLGCTLYHCLTGQPPFPGGTLAEKLLKHQQAEAIPVEKLRPEVPADIRRIVDKMLAKRPQDRHQAPHEVAASLAPFASPASEPILAIPVIPGDSTRETVSWAVTPTLAGAPVRPLWRRKNLVISAAVIVPILAILPLIWPRAGQPEAQPVAKQTPAATETPPDKQPPPKADGPVQKPAPKKPAPTEEPKPEPPPPKEPPLPFVLGEVATLPALPDAPGKLIKQLKGHTGTIHFVAFSPDGKRLASGGEDNQVRLWNAGTGNLLGPALKHGEQVRVLAWSPDGTRLASAGWQAYDASIKLWDQSGQTKPQTLPWSDRTGTPSLAEVRGLAFSPDGKYLAAGGGPVRVWKLSDGNTPTVFEWQKTFPSYVYAVAFSPDGKSVAAGCHETGDSVRLWEIDSAGEPLVLRGNDQAFGIGHQEVRGTLGFVGSGKLFVRVTSDGTAIGFQQPGASVRVWELDAKTKDFSLRDTYKIPGGGVFAMAGAKDGTLRVAVARGSPGALRPVMPADPQPGHVHLWDSATQQARTLATGHKSSITALGFSADGSHLATGSEDQTVKLWDLSSAP